MRMRTRYTDDRNARSVEGASAMTRDRELTDRQRQVLEFIKAETERQGFPPTVRDIGAAVGLSSSSTVHAHLEALEAKGLIRRDPSKPRALEVLSRHDDAPRRLVPANVVELPVVGSVAAGVPILAVENIETMISLPTEVVRDDATFVLRVKGDSMIGAGIFDGDYVVVREQPTAANGDIVVAQIDDEATVKRFFREADRVRLQPENAAMEPIYTRDVTVLGKVVAVFRRM
jgi:repressor LexA